MQTVSTLYKASIDAKKRSIQAILDLYTGDALTDSFQSDRIVNIEIQRAGEQSKFFGFGVYHKATIKLLDKNRELNITKDNYFKLKLGVEVLGEVEYKRFPKFYVSEVTRDENNNELTIVAFDILDKATAHTVAELGVNAPYTLKEYAEAATYFLDGVKRENTDLFQQAGPYAWYNVDGVTIDETGLITVNGTFESPTAFYVKLTDVNTYNGTFKMNLVKSGGSYTTDSSPYFSTTGGDGNNFSSTTKYYSSTNGTTWWTSGARIATLMLMLPAGTYNNSQFRMTMFSSSFTPVPGVFNDETIPGLILEYPEGANIEGTETIREILTAIAEATQTIFYVGGDDLIRFRRLSDTVDKYISKDIYISLKGGENRSLQTIASITELGDNLEATTGQPGEKQYVRDNPFWELREDAAAVLDTALEEVAGTSINQFECEWRGDPALEPGDRIAYTTKDDGIGYTYFLNDTLTYNGGLRQKSDWNFKDGETVSTNLTNLGEVIKQTYAKVDKQNKEIEIVAGEASANAQEIAALKINTESISASVTKVQEANTDAIESLNGELVTLTKKVETSMTAEDVQIQIKSELSNGVDKVTTATGFTFNEEGLTIAKTGSEMTTNIDEDGMSVYRDNQEVLTADNQGVIAYNLKAKTYLIVGENSRFEDFTSTTGEQRTGCFWIGG